MNEDIKFLQEAGFIVGDRDPRINTSFPGAFMVSEPYTEAQLPTIDGSKGIWAIVGDDLEQLAADAASFFRYSE